MFEPRDSTHVIIVIIGFDWQYRPRDAFGREILKCTQTYFNPRETTTGWPRAFNRRASTEKKIVSRRFQKQPISMQKRGGEQHAKAEPPLSQGRG